jgi:hypothetical protein
LAGQRMAQSPLDPGRAVGRCAPRYFRREGDRAAWQSPRVP